MREYKRRRVHVNISDRSTNSRSSTNATPFIADDPSDTSIEEVQQSDTLLATSTSSRTLLGETQVPSSSASVTPTKILVHPETLRPFGHLEARKEVSTKRKKDIH